MATTVDTDLGRLVSEESGQNIYLCYQCKKCTCGCPLADQFDLTPAQLVRALQFGQVDKVLHSRTMWLCAYCETCFTRCPVELDIPRLMDTLKGIATKRGIKPPDPIFTAFNEAALAWIERAGRIHDAGLIAEVNLRLGRPFRDARVGLELLRRGKIRPVPEWPGQPRDLPKPAPKHGNPKRVGYFPGCTLHSSGREYDESTRAVAKHVGIDPDLADVELPLETHPVAVPRPEVAAGEALVESHGRRDLRDA